MNHPQWGIVLAVAAVGAAGVVSIARETGRVEHAAAMPGVPQLSGPAPTPADLLAVVQIPVNRADVTGQTVANPFAPLVPVVPPAPPAPPVAPPVVAKPTPAAPPVAPTPPAAPTAPPLPFTVMGGISGQRIADGQPVVFLRLRDDVVVARAGDEIEKTYRVEAVLPDRIEFTYIPLKQRQSLILAP